MFYVGSRSELHGGGRTVIEPAVTLEVLDEGSLRTYLPSTIRFRDGERLRPVAPFFELWASVESVAGTRDTRIERRERKGCPFAPVAKPSASRSGACT